jgi:hypothetical protein
VKRSEALTAVKITTLLFCVVTSCGLMGRCQSFGGTYRLQLQGWYMGVRKWIVYTLSEQGLRWEVIGQSDPRKEEMWDSTR